MGKIRSKKILRIANDLLERHKDKFSTDFQHNKEVLKELDPPQIPSKKIRNIIAGYLVRELKKAE